MATYSYINILEFFRFVQQLNLFKWNFYLVPCDFVFDSFQSMTTYHRRIYYVKCVFFTLFLENNTLVENLLDQDKLVRRREIYGDCNIFVIYLMLFYRISRWLLGKFGNG